MIAHRCFSLTLCKSISLHKSCVFSHSLSLAGCHTPFWEPTLFPEFMVCFTSCLIPWIILFACVTCLVIVWIDCPVLWPLPVFGFTILDYSNKGLHLCTWILNLCVWAVHDSFSYLQFTRHFHWSIAPPPPFFLIELWKNRLWINKI